MPEMIEVERCPICESPIYVKLVPAHWAQLPDEVYTCRCRIVYPERFKRMGEHGYAVGRPSVQRPARR